MKTRIIIFLILLFFGSKLNAQEYRSLVQTDKNLLGKIRTLFDPATIKLNANNISIKYDELKEPMAFYFYEKVGVEDNGEYIRTAYVLTDETRNEQGYSLCYIDRYKKIKTKENFKYNIGFIIVMIDLGIFNATGEFEDTRFTCFYSMLK